MKRIKKILVIILMLLSTTTLNAENLLNRFITDKLLEYIYGANNYTIISGGYNEIEEYLFNRQEISLIIFFFFIRHEPTANDKLMYDYVIRSKLPFIVLANKADKIAPTKVNNYVLDIQKILNPIGDNIFLPFSSEKKIYSEAVWNEIEKSI